MRILASTSLTGLIEQAIAGFVQNVVYALPTIITGIVSLTAAVRIRTIRTVTGDRPPAGLPQPALYAKFAITVIEICLWTGAFLTSLIAVDLGEIAAAFGTASEGGIE